MPTCFHTSSQHHNKLSIEVKARWKGEQVLSTVDFFTSGLMSAYRRRDETRRRGIVGVKTVDVQKSARIIESNRRVGREIKAE